MRNLLKTAKTGYLSRFNPLIREFTISDFMDLTVETNTTSSMDLFLFGTNIIRVDWGDGTDPELIKGSFDGSSQSPFTASDAFKYTHTYASAGVYQVRIEGFIAYANLGLFSRYKQYYDYDLEQWVTINENNTNIERIVSFEGTGENFSSLFANCIVLNDAEVPLSGLVNVDTMNHTFSSCDQLEYFDSSGLNSLVNIDSMFYDSDNVSGINFEGFTNVTSANYMLERNYDLEYADLTAMSGLQYANRMFHASYSNPFNHYYSSGKGSIASGEFDGLSGLLEAEAMFFNQSLTDATFVDNYDGLISANHMLENNNISHDVSFDGLDSLQFANDMYKNNSISGVDFSGGFSLKQINSIFEGNDLFEIDLSPPTTVSNLNYAFASNQLSGVDLSVLSNYTDLRTMAGTFQANPFTNVDQELSDLFSLTNAPNLIRVDYLFRNCSISGVDLDPFNDAGNLSGLYYLDGMFAGNQMSSVDISPMSGLINIPQNVTIKNFFQSNNISSIDLDPLKDLTNVYDLSYFLHGNDLTFIDLSFFNTMDHVTNLRGMFSFNNLSNTTDFSPISSLTNLMAISDILRGNNLATVDLDDFIGNVGMYNFSDAFSYNYITSVDLSALNTLTSNFVNCSYMFHRNDISTINASHLSKVYNGIGMFHTNNITTLTMTGTNKLYTTISMFAENNLSSANISGLTNVRDISGMLSGSLITSLTMPTTANSLYRATNFLYHSSIAASVFDGYLIQLASIVPSRPGYTIGDTLSETSYTYNFQYYNASNANTLDSARSASALTAIQDLKDKGWVRGAESNY